MKLTVIGCSGSFAGPESSASCYLLEAPIDNGGGTFRLLVDLGSGALGALQRHCDPLSIDAVLISHLHADHFFDISGYYVLRKYHPSGCQPRIPVWGPRGTKSRVAHAYGLPLDPGMNEEFKFRRISRKKTMQVGPFTVTASRMDHPIEAYGLRVECGGKVLAYSGDTAPCDALVQIAEGADLFLAEAAFRDDCDNPPNIHMTGSEAAAVAAQAKVSRLVLTHIPPWHDKNDAVEESKGHYDGPVELAAEGRTYEL
jgi:ribonuclease BN (tRNA processing enzyme)